MTELLAELITKWVILFAVLSVGCTEVLMRATPEAVTKRKYALLSTVIMAIIMSMAYSFRQTDVSWQDGLARGFISAVVAVLAYDTLKMVVINLPFINKS